MAVVNSLPKDKNDKIETCKDLADLFIQQLTLKSIGHDEIRLAFDRYISDSLKFKTRQGRTKSIQSIHYKINDSTVIKDITLKELLANIDTKKELTEYLAKKIISYSKSVARRIMVTYDTKTEGNTYIPEILRQHDHEEADTLIILHASTVDRSSLLHVAASDTDILLQFTHRYQHVPEDTVLLGKSVEYPIKVLHTNLGEQRCRALVGFHVFTGCDVSGKFAGRTKESTFKKFLEADSDILASLTNLGNSVDMPSEYTLQGLERFVCLLYGSTKIKNVKSLRWFMYSRKQCEGENHPPSFGALLEHIKRAHFISMVYSRNLINMQQLPSPEHYGWKYNDVKEIYEPVMTSNLPAPLSVIDLVKCDCKKGCTKRCSYRKNELSCTEICGCTDTECLNPFNSAVNKEDVDVNNDDG